MGTDTLPDVRSSVSELGRRKEVRFSRAISSASGNNLKLSGHGRSPVSPLMPHTCAGLFHYSLVLRLVCSKNC